MYKPYVFSHKYTAIKSLKKINVINVYHFQKFPPILSIFVCLFHFFPLFVVRPFNLRSVLLEKI